jgi:hypothetical protein
MWLYNMQENNRSELNRLDREKKEDMLEMIKGYVTSQVLFSSLCLFFISLFFFFAQKSTLIHNFLGDYNIGSSLKVTKI